MIFYPSAQIIQSQQWLCIIQNCPEVSIFIAALLTADKRRLCWTLSGGGGDGLIKRFALFERWRGVFGALLGRLVAGEGLWGVKSCLSDKLLSPSDSHSEEPGEEREDGGEDE